MQVGLAHETKVLGDVLVVLDLVHRAIDQPHDACHQRLAIRLATRDRDQAANVADQRVLVDIPVEIKLRSGTDRLVSTIGSEGPQRLRSTNGRIEVDDAQRGVDAHTTNGSIDVELARAADAPQIEIGTTNGSITLHLPGDAQGSLEARTVNGTVRTDLPLTVHGSHSKRRVDADLNGGGEGRIVLRTTNGSIRIVEPAA